MKQNIDKFNSVISTKQSEVILRDLQRRQENGEIRSAAELRLELEKSLREVSNRGRIVVEIPVNPSEIISSERMADFFRNVSQDIEILFTEVDASETSIVNLAQIIQTQIRNLEFSLGQLKSELIERKIKIPPGSGWSIILRDSFERGYGQLLGRAELDVNLFKDIRTGLVQDGEVNPIKADAKIEGVAKKLILPELEDEEVGFKNIKLNWSSGTTPGDTAFDNSLPIYNAIDKSNSTFWSHVVLNSVPLLGDTVTDVTQVAGYESDGELIINASGIKDPRRHDYFVQVVSTSGNIRYQCYADLSQSLNTTCKWDKGQSCNWGYETFYSVNCTNTNCSRYEDRLYTASGVYADLYDGYDYDTGIDFEFSGVVHAGQAWKVSVEPSGTIGAQIELELTTAKPGYINWMELDPVSDSPYYMTSVEYTRPGTSGRIAIISGVIEAADKVRLDFPNIEAEKLYIKLRQENYTETNAFLKERQIALTELLEARDKTDQSSIDEFYKINLEQLLFDYLPNGPLQQTLGKRITAPRKLVGNLYQFGIFDITCGSTSYADTAVAVTKGTRAVTPRMFAVQGDLEPAITYASGIQSGALGTLEFSIVRWNYDENNSLINIEDFPLPETDTNGYITERLFIDENGEGYLRFSADTVDYIKVVSLGRTLASDEYIITEELDTVIRTKVSVTRKDISQTAVVIVKYKPKTGVYINQDKTLRLEDNSLNQLSLSDLQVIVVANDRTANRDISYSDIHMRIILRRNSPDIFTTPGLRDYQLYISEADPGRFF